MNNPGAVTGVAIQVYDLDGMKQLYETLFSTRFEREVTNGAAVWRSMAGELELTLAPWRRDQDFDGFPIHQLTVTVDDLEATLAGALGAGGRLLEAPREQNGARRASLRDVDGNTLELVQAS